MNLHQKTIVIICLTLILLVGLMYAYSETFLLSSYIKVEKQNMERDVQRALSALSNNISYINVVACDYAWWDDTYAFIENRSVEYLNSSYTDSTFSETRINLILILDNSEQIVYAQGFDLEKNQKTSIPDSTYQYIIENKRLTHHTDETVYETGIIRLPEGCMMIASQPILTSDGKGPIRGTFIVGRYLNSLEVQRFSLATHMSISMYLVDDPEIQPELEKLNSRFWDSNIVDIQMIDKKTIVGYTLLSDIYGEPVLLFKVDSPRVIFQKGNESIHFFIVFLILSGIVFGFVIIKLLKKVVISRMANLSNEVKQIGEVGNLTARVPVEGKDELASLAETINNMLVALEGFQKSEARYVSLVNQLQTAHQQVTDIIDFLPDATFVVNCEKKIIAWNQAMQEMTGIVKEEIVGKGDYAYAIPFYGKPRPVLIDLIWSEHQDCKKEYEFLKRKGHTLSAEVFVPSLNNGKGAFLMVTASPLFDGNGNQVGGIESIRDITEKKVAEEKQQYLSMHDSLTGLYNRTYFEQMMAELDKQSISVGIILADVDGLKIVNDTLGHEAGDSMLKAATEILRKSLEDHVFLARIGGDEFAIFITGKEENEVEDITNQLRAEVEKYNEANPQLLVSMSFGYAVCEPNSQISDVFKEADNNMYREKLHHNKSNRSAIVQTLMKALEARDFITEAHAQRLQNLVVAVGLAIGLPEHSNTDLRLLAKFHDIGKVGIPDRILFKKGPLTSEEYAEMKLHCEIGFRIAQTALELVPIADGILKHHERWDGKGYPLGLKGEEIPVECRILALADAYDAMTSDRPYRKAMTKDKVIAELRRCSGTQFDPNLVEKFIEVLEQQERLL